MAGRTQFSELLSQDILDLQASPPNRRRIRRPAGMRVLNPGNVLRAARAKMDNHCPKEQNQTIGT